MTQDASEQLKFFQQSLMVEAGHIFHLRFGPLDLYLQKSDIELTVKWASSNDWMDNSFSHEYPYAGMVPENLLTTERVAFSRKIEKLRIYPCLGDRSFVAKPFTRLTILPGDKAKIFLSTPMSVRVVDEASGQTLVEIPVIDRPLTWFGENTIKGELCYFTQINAALSEEDMPFRPHRAMTHVHIFNRSKKPLEIERLRIPVPYFKLFQRDNGRFVTSSLDVYCDVKGQIRDIKVRPPKTNITNLTPICEPNLKAKRSLFARSVKELMG